MTFHLLASYSLIAASSAALFLLISKRPLKTTDTHFVLGKFGIMHILFGSLSAKAQWNSLDGAPTLYQCFFTLPSVRCGNVYNSTTSQ